MKIIEGIKLKGRPAEIPDSSRNELPMFLKEIGYDRSNWEIFEYDLREQHLTLEAIPGKSSPFGEKFEITAPIIGPNGEERMIKTIWMIKYNETVARFITLIPEKKQ